MTEENDKIESNPGEPDVPANAFQNIEERITSIGYAIIDKALEIIDRNNTRGKGSKKVSASELMAHEENQKQFKILEATYMKLKKMKLINVPVKSSGDDSESYTSDEILKKAKDKKSSMTAIVTSIHKKNATG